MTAEERGNKLSVDPKLTLEYLIHGKFFRSEDDQNGFHGAFWFSLRELRAFFSRQTIEALLAEFEEKQTENRDEVLSDIDDEIREEAEAELNGEAAEAPGAS